MGDMVNGELNEWSFASVDKFAWVSMPRTGIYHLHGIDTLSILTND